jgi:hypothetical protein
MADLSGEAAWRQRNPSRSPWRNLGRSPRPRAGSTPQECQMSRGSNDPAAGLSGCRHRAGCNIVPLRRDQHRACNPGLTRNRVSPCRPPGSSCARDLGTPCPGRAPRSTGRHRRSAPPRQGRHRPQATEWSHPGTRRSRGDRRSHRPPSRIRPRAMRRSLKRIPAGRSAPRWSSPPRP